MIVTTDIADIIYRDCKSFGIKIVPFGKIISEETTQPLTEERITIHVKEPTDGKYWEKRFVEVNLCVPDLSLTEDNHSRLKELERMASKKFKSVAGYFDGTGYRYSGVTSIEADTALKCHFVNCRILFNVINTI